MGDWQKQTDWQEQYVERLERFANEQSRTSTWEVGLVDDSVITCHIFDRTFAKVISGELAFMEYLPLGKTAEPQNWVYINVNHIASFKLLV